MHFNINWKLWFQSGGHVNEATVSVSAPTGSSSALYLPKLVAILRKHGFTVVGKGQPAEYSAELEMNAGVWNVQCTINLQQRGVPLISASNLEWGNWLARGASIQIVADSAIREFDKKLAGLLIWRASNRVFSAFLLSVRISPRLNGSRCLFHADVNSLRLRLVRQRFCLS